MAYLARRLKAFLEDLQAGTIALEADIAAALKPELDAVRISENGDPILETISPAIRDLALGYDVVRRTVGDAAGRPPSPEPRIGEKRLAELMRTLFKLYEELIVAATGVAPNKVPTHEAFVAAVRRKEEQGRLRSNRWQQEVQDRADALVRFYKSSWQDVAHGAKQLPGLKMVLGGQQSFRGSGLAAARSTLLYTDTLLIPDAVARWFETARPFEAKAFPRMLGDVYGLLQLKPLVDAELPYPAVVVFHSVERSLEDNDLVTQDGIERIVLDFFSHYLDARFDSLDEIVRFIAKDEARFVKATTTHRLLVGMGGTGNEDFPTAVQLVRKFYREYRSEAFVEEVEATPDAGVAYFAIRERLVPHYHLAENAALFDASPLVSLPVHWHYSELLNEVRSSTLAKADILKDQHAAIIRAANATEHRWLGNVPMKELAELRQRGEATGFREQVKKLVVELAGADETSLDKLVPAVDRALSDLLRQHDREVAKLIESYEEKYTPQAVAAWLTMGALWTPWFPTLVPAIAALGVTGAYLGTKGAELMKRRRLGKTLTGILAASARKK